jgi:hypothetical protein
MTLAERLLAIDAAFASAGFEHAFGGAIALAYWTEEPRGTRDIDVNVFVAPDQARQVLAALPHGVRWDEGAVATAERDGQVRVWWDDTPIDLFFDYAAIHAEAAAYRRRVPFEGSEIPVLGPVELVVFKAMFDRTRDWADIEAMFAAGTVDTAAVRAALAPILSDDDHRLGRLADAEGRGIGE